MILFLNFAPFAFGGGAERWMLDVSKEIKKNEDIFLLDTKQSVSDWYGNFVLKQPYSQRMQIDEKNHISIGISSLIPFTGQWKRITKLVCDARLIYIRYELLESLIILFYGGYSSLKKTIAGTHSPVIYRNPVSITDFIHNWVYDSLVNPFILNSIKKIHVLNFKDKNYLSQKLRHKEIVHIPNYINLNNKILHADIQKKNKFLNIAFVGVLNKRKGADILLDVINKSPDNFFFHIAGEGPYAKDIVTLISSKKVKYYGYLSQEKLKKLYNSCDVLFLPSRAEAFSLACLEAMSHGLPVISSPETDLGLPGYAQIVNANGTTQGYLQILVNLYKYKLSGKIKDQKSKVRKLTQSKFSDTVILPQLRKKLFEIL